MYGLLVLLGLVSIYKPGLGAGNSWYVAHGGRNDRSCGTSRDDPCGDLDSVIYNAFSGDKIYIESSPSLHVLCSHKDVMRKSLSIIGVNGRARVGCDEHDDSDVIMKYGSTPGGYSLTMESLVLVNGPLVFGNGTLHLVDVHFINATIQSVDGGCHQLVVTMDTCHFMNHGLCGENTTCGTSAITCTAANIDITDSTFMASPVKLTVSNKVDVTVRGSVFRGENHAIQGLYITSRDGLITVDNSTFSHHHSPSMMSYSLNLYEASLMMRGSSRTNTSTVHFNIKHTDFTVNDRGLTVMGDYIDGTVDHCTFTDNTAMHSGAAILSLTGKNSNMSVRGSTFTDNRGGRVMERLVELESPGAVEVSSHVVYINKACCKGSLKPIGRGGAVRVQRGHVEISDCRFTGNSANLQGGSVMVDTPGTLIMNRVHIEGSKDEHQAVMGELLYSRGQTKLHDVHLVGVSSHRGHSLLDHSGDHWSLKVSRIWVECPMGHNLRLHNVSAFGVTPAGMRSAVDMYDELSYSCHHCPYGSYSYDHGYVNDTLVVDSGGSVYYNLKINGDPLDEVKYRGSYVLHEVQCSPCPDNINQVMDNYDYNNMYDYYDDESDDSKLDDDDDTDDTDDDTESMDDETSGHGTESEEENESKEEEEREEEERLVVLRDQCPGGAATHLPVNSLITFTLLTLLNVSV